ncbi:MAG TPA: PAS domain S-box protein [Burkholderiales bacterium]|nr:PAS domain S-box protein [Burkholderiales bacterium]
MSAAPTLVTINHTVRSGAFAWCLLTIGLYLWTRHAGPIAWTLLVLQFVVYPHVVYWRAVRSSRPSAAERDNLLLDSALLGAWSAYLGFPLWITWMMIGAATLNAVVNRGATGALVALGCSAVGAGLWILIGEWRLTPHTGPWVTLLSLVGGLGYTCSVGYVVWRQNRRLLAARAELAKSEERYRLIAENADDLVAMVSEKGKWVYTSPSYGRILDTAELSVDGDAFARLHPDDAEALRKALLTGKARDLPLRLVDRDGRMRQYRSHLQPVADNFLLVSRDVTDLRASEERMLLAAHALEGMAEAIMITAADGTVVNVNRAFTEITGYPREDVLGQPATQTRSGLNPPEFYQQAFEAVARNGYWSGTTWSRRKNGTIYREWRSLRAVKDPAGKVTHYVHVFYEVGAQRSAAGAPEIRVGA